jgi:signal transduction histidine kinase
VLKLQDAYRAIEREKAAFMAMLIHDMRSPLTSLGMFLELLDEEIPGPLNQEQKRAVESCRTSTRRLLNLVNHVLDLSKLEAGQLKPDILPRPVHDLVDLPLLNADLRARAQGVILVRDLAAEETVLAVDPELIEQVLTNLLDNALKHSPEGGSITLGGELLGGSYRFVVRDQGPGIPEEKHREIFEAYRQVKNGVMKKKGTGLGLSIARLIVEAHGGGISVESAPGGGAVFAFELPVERNDV